MYQIKYELPSNNFSLIHVRNHLPALEYLNNKIAKILPVNIITTLKPATHNKNLVCF